jgi:hypothetical protein
MPLAAVAAASTAANESGSVAESTAASAISLGVETPLALDWGSAVLPLETPNSLSADSSEGMFVEGLIANSVTTAKSEGVPPLG